MLTAFPLQNKKMQQLSLPFLSIGICEVMNSAAQDSMGSFALHNTRNRGFFPSDMPFMGEMAACGLCDGVTTGRACSGFVAPTLARILDAHAVLPGSIAKVCGEYGKNDLIVQLIKSTSFPDRAMRPGNSSQTIKRVGSEWAMRQYAIFTDGAFFNAHRRTDIDADSEALTGCDTVNSGCRAVWFTATVSPFGHFFHNPVMESKTTGGAENHLPPFCLDVLASNVGDSRAFGIARHPRSRVGRLSVLDPSRESVVPLSADHRPLRTEEFHRIHRAGGTVCAHTGEIVNVGQRYNVSRSFGHWAMKSDQRLPPAKQLLTAMPSCRSWAMLPGDVLVLSNRAIFATRRMEDSSVDEAAKVVARELDRGAAPQEAAAALCEFAIRFGAAGALQVAVAIANDGDKVEEPRRDVFVAPGPIYAAACRHAPEYREALQADCVRCGVDLAQLIELRWRRVRDLLAMRHTLPLMPYYGRECSALQQIMDEEAILFSHPALSTTKGSGDAKCEFEGMQGNLATAFKEIAKSLLIEKAS